MSLHPFKLLYPVLMFVIVWRTVGVSVRSDRLIVFKPNEARAHLGDEGSRASSRMSSRLVQGWKRDTSV